MKKIHLIIKMQVIKNDDFLLFLLKNYYRIL